MHGRQLAYWNGMGAAKAFAHPLRLDWLSGLGGQARILEYGCGYGRNLQALHEQGCRNLVGVDFAGAMIERGVQLHPHLDLRKTDGLPLAEPDGAFDAVLLFAVLTCIPSDEDQQALVDELKRLLRPDGLLYVSDYPLQTDERNLARYREGSARHSVYGVFDHPDGAVFRHHAPGRLQTLLSRFDWLECEEIDTVTLSGQPARAVQLLARNPL